MVMGISTQFSCYFCEKADDTTLSTTMPCACCCAVNWIERPSIMEIIWFQAPV